MISIIFVIECIIHDSCKQDGTIGYDSKSHHCWWKQPEELAFIWNCYPSTLWHWKHTISPNINGDKTSNFVVAMLTKYY